MMQDIADLLDGLKRSPKVLAAFVGSIPEGRMNRRRGDGFWTIAEHVSHLAQVQPMLFDRLLRLMNEDHPEFVPYIPGDGKDEPDAPKPMETATAIDLFTRDRNKQLTLVESADGAVWQKQGTHPEYDQYSFYIFIRHILMHDHWHMYRMEELWLTKDPYLTRLE